MKKSLAFSMLLAAASASAAIPTVSNVTVSQGATGLIEVKYDLSGADGIVTMDVLTNGVSIGYQNIGGLVGSVNKKLTAGNGKHIWWRPSVDAADQNVYTTANFTVKLTAWTEADPPDYLVYDMTEVTDDKWKRWYYPAAEAVPYGVTNDLYKTTRMVFRRIHAAGQTFRVGSPTREVGRGLGYSDPKIVVAKKEDGHFVTLTNDFYLAIYEMTKRQYQITSGEANLRGYFNDGPEAGMRPVETTSWNTLCNRYGGPADEWTGANNTGVHYTRWSAYAFMGTFRTKSGFSKAAFPTEAEWEFACRAGEGAAFPWGGELVYEDGVYSNADLGDYAWYDQNAGGTTHVVGLKKPNKWGIYDMLGNVTEICWDRAYASSSDLSWSANDVDPCILRGDPEGQYSSYTGIHPHRGGSYLEPATACRSASRSCPQVTDGWTAANAPNGGHHMGFRISMRIP